MSLGSSLRVVAEQLLVGSAGRHSPVTSGGIVGDELEERVDVGGNQVAQITLAGDLLGAVADDQTVALEVHQVVLRRVVAGGVIKLGGDHFGAGLQLRVILRIEAQQVDRVVGVYDQHAGAVAELFDR